MSTHPDPEQLSAYIDGELTGNDRDDVEQHLTGCSDCSATVRGLRATVADLRALPAPAPSEQESWALRAAINRARKRPATRYRRWTVAAGSVAAVAAAIVATTLTLGHNNRSARDNTAAALADRASLIVVEGTNYSPDTARTLATATVPVQGPVAGLVPPPSSKAEHSPAPAAGTLGSPSSHSGGEQFSAITPAPAPSSYLPAILNCERQVLAGNTAPRTPIRYVVARFEGIPAFFLVYSVKSGSEEKIELWVVQQSDCYIRFFVPPR